MFVVGWAVRKAVELFLLAIVEEEYIFKILFKQDKYWPVICKSLQVLIIILFSLSKNNSVLEERVIITVYGHIFLMFANFETIKVE